MKTVAIVPIKKKSERVVGKNFRLVGGKPLYQHLLDKLNHSLFDEIYIDEEFYDQGYVNFPQQDIEDTYVKMKISEEMNPNDGIIEGFILVRLENEELVFHVFLDEDWKLKVNGETNLVWGTRYENFRKFRFEEINDGIYMDKVKEEKERFSEDFSFHKGNVMVGNFTLEQIEQQDSTEGLFVIRII